MKNIIIVIILLIGLIQSLKSQSGNQVIGNGAGPGITGSFNTMYGDSTGFLTTIANGTTLAGYKAGRSNNADHLTAFGYLAAYTNTAGIENTFLGYEAGRLNKTGNSNLAIGAESGEHSSMVSNNTFVGEESGTNNVTGSENTFIGEDAGFSNTSGYRQVFIGSEVGVSSDLGYANVSIGSESSSDVDDGHHNTALGDSALIDVGDGIYNTILGQASGVATEWADYNTFVGSRAGWDNNRDNNPTNANRNTYVGFETGRTNRGGQDNVGIGALANFDFNNRSRCTFIGADLNPSSNDVLSVGYKNHADNQYGVGIGNDQNQRNGAGSIAIGHGIHALNSNVAYSIAIGYLADFDEANSKNRSIGIGNEVRVSSLESVVIGADATISGDKSVGAGDDVVLSGKNSIAIGSQLELKSNYEAFFGNAATTTIGSTLNWTATSDGRFKKNVKENVPGLAFINQLRPVSYQFDVEELSSVIGGNVNDIGVKKLIIYSGFIAQEVQHAADEINYAFSGVKVPNDTINGNYGIRYAAFTVPLTKAIQELNTSSLDQTNQLNNSLLLISDQRERINDLTRDIIVFEQKLISLQEQFLENTEAFDCTDCNQLLTAITR